MTDLDVLEARARAMDGEPIAVNSQELLELIAAHRIATAEPRSALVRHHFRQRQIEKLRHALQEIVGWKEPIACLAAEAEAMHLEVERLRAVLAHIAAGGLRPAEVASRALREESACHIPRFTTSGAVTAGAAATTDGPAQGKTP